MKVIQKADGTIEYDVQTPADIKLLRELQAQGNGNGSNPSTACLNDKQYHAYTYLVDNDNEIGVHYSRYAEHANIQKDAAHERFSRLCELGVATKDGLEAGKFRAA